MNYIEQICEMLKVKVDVPFITAEDKYFCKIDKNGETSWSEDGKHWEIDKVIFWHLMWGILTVYKKTYRDDFFEKFPNARLNRFGRPLRINVCELLGIKECPYKGDVKCFCENCKMWDKETE